MKKFIAIITIFVSVLLSVATLRQASAAPPSAINNIVDSKTFILALENDYPPFLYYENGMPKGISYDYAKLISDKLGYKLTTTEPKQLQQNLDDVKNDKANLLSDITKTPERQEYLEFSKPYVETPAVIIGRKNEATEWSNKRTNENLSVAVGKSYGVVSYLKNKYPKADFVEFSSDIEVLDAVALGATEIGVLDESSLSYVLQKRPLSNIEVIGHAGFNYSLSFAVSKENKDAIPLINQVIDNISPKERSDIFSKWISSLPVEKESDVIDSIPTYARYIIVGLPALLLVTLAIIFVLRKQVKGRTKDLNDLNSSLDAKAKEKVQEALELANVNELQKSNLEDTKKAMLNILEDVEEEKNKLAAISKRLDLATSGANIGISEWDVKHNKMVWNDEMYKLFDLDKSKVHSTAELLEQSREVILPEDKDKTAKKREEELNKGGKYDIVFRVKWRDGSVHYLRSFGTSEEKDGKVAKIYSVNLDVTREQEIDKAKSEFVSLASHQLRTPLSSINWYSELLLSGDVGKLNKQQLEYMHAVDNANTRMVELINALLNVSRLELGTFVLESEKLNPKDCAEQIIKEIKTRSDVKHQQLNIVFDPKTPEIVFDKKYLEMLYQNLLSNAVKYTSEKGKIDLIVGPAIAGQVVDGYTIPNEGIMITVADNGYGIPKNQQDKIMTKLFRADNALDKDADGTGLGLYIIKSVIDHSNGNLWFKSVENKGTTFHAYLPLETAKKEGTKKLS
jgi:signal transduction histidine kinase/ABC-type amino acid transport substrate-binding protein